MITQPVHSNPRTQTQDPALLEPNSVVSTTQAPKLQAAEKYKNYILNIEKYYEKYKEQRVESVDNGYYNDDYDSYSYSDSCSDKPDYSWRDICDDGSEYGIDPEDYETEDEYLDALSEAATEAEW